MNRDDEFLIDDNVSVWTVTPPDMPTSTPTTPPQQPPALPSQEATTPTTKKKRTKIIVLIVFLKLLLIAGVLGVLGFVFGVSRSKTIVYSFTEKRIEKNFVGSSRPSDQSDEKNTKKPDPGRSDNLLCYYYRSPSFGGTAIYQCVSVKSNDGSYPGWFTLPVDPAIARRFSGDWSGNACAGAKWSFSVKTGRCNAKCPCRNHAESLCDCNKGSLLGQDLKQSMQFDFVVNPRIFENLAVGYEVVYCVVMTTGSRLSHHNCAIPKEAGSFNDVYVPMSLPTIFDKKWAKEGFLTNCFHPWFFHPQLDSCYWLQRETKFRWQKSEDICKRNGGHLATIDSAKEILILQDILAARQVSNEYIWIGGEVDGDWKWVGNGQPLDGTNWDVGEPNYSLLKHCATMKGGKFQSDVCLTSYGFLCEKPSI